MFATLGFAILAMGGLCSQAIVGNMFVYVYNYNTIVAILKKIKGSIIIYVDHELDG